MAGLGLNSLRLGLLSSTSFSPSALFKGGEQGVWYDPSDLTTLFQDSAGTTPVTAAGQSVGLVLDKRLGLVPGSELLGNGATALVGTATAASYNTSTGAGSVTRVDLSNQSYVQWTGLNNTSVYKITITNTSSPSIAIRVGGPSAAAYATIAIGATVTAHVFPSSGIITITTASLTGSFVVSSFRELPGSHAIQSTALLRPTYQVDGNGRSYLSFDGSDDFLVTPTITPGTDKAQLFAGVRKLGDTGYQCIAELSATAATIAGSVTLGASSLTGDPSRRTWSSVLSGSIVGNTGGAGVYAAPTTAVLAGLFDIAQTTAATEQVLRVNGAAVTQTYSTADAGTGSFAANPIYIGRRGGNANPLNGRIYGLIARFGPNLTNSQIASVEKFLAAKAGITF